MKIYVLVSQSHLSLLNEWFLPSLNGELPVEIRYMPQMTSGEYKSPGWTSAMLEKVALIQSAIQENWGGEFLYSDVDIQFLGPITEPLTDLPADTDLFFQKDSPSGMLCAGFFVCRANARTASFFQHVAVTLRERPGSGDQDIVNELLNPPSASHLTNFWRRLISPLEVRARYTTLPDSFFGGGTFTGKVWQPGEQVMLPERPLMHHANWTVGIANKMAQLAWVRNEISLLKSTSSIAPHCLPVRQSGDVLPGQN